jgi:16S rRNA (guanine966-N2)-methyltransferase
MSIKILGGKARGFPLALSRNEVTRPTSVLVRRKLFDWRQSLEGLEFVDLCAGTGAMGLEALSRGAEGVYLNELNRQAYFTLKKNAEKLQAAFDLAGAKVTLHNLDARQWLERELRFQLPDTSRVILFLDPPYEDHKLYTDVLEGLRTAGFAGELWLEADRLKGPPREALTGAFRSIIKVVDQGDHFVVVGKLL